MRPLASLVRRNRRLATLAMILAAAAGVPAAAQLAGFRDTSDPQLSINNDLPLFTISDLQPGDSITRCVRVRNEGNDPVRVDAAASVTGDLAQYLVAKVERGTGLGDVGLSCTGFTPAGYIFGTNASGIPATSLQPATDPSWPGLTARSFRLTLTLPASTGNEAQGKSATVNLSFVGSALAPTGTTTTPSGSGGSAGGVASGTTGGLDANGKFISNSKVKKLFRVGKARLLKNGDVVVGMYLPAGGAVRAKVIINGATYYAQRLYKRVLPGKLHVVLHRRPVGRIAVSSAKRKHRTLASLVTTRYRWAHGPDAFVQPQQKLTLVKG